MAHGGEVTSPSGSCLIVSYHYVRDTAGSRFPRINALSRSGFSSQVEQLVQACDMLDYAAMIEIVGGTRRPDRPSALLTFDDGLVDHYETVFPLLQAHSLRGIFFVSPPSGRVLNVQKTQLLLATIGGEALLGEVKTLAARAGYVPTPHPVPPVLYRYDAEANRQVKQLLNYELPYAIADELLTSLFERHVGPEQELAPALYLSEAMIKEMSRAGMTIGFHTHRHRVLSRLNADQQRVDIHDGVEWIKGITGQATVPFCYPHGHAHAYNQDTLAVVRDAGYSMAFTAVRAMSRPGDDHRYEIPRYDTCDVSAALATMGLRPGAWVAD